jgi:RNA polymerase sigma factor (sigma-70 family)
MTDADDTILIAAVVQNRSDRAARRLVERHSPRLLAMVSRLLGSDHAAAEDVLQESWIKGIEMLPRFRREAAFFTWMTRITVRTAFDHLRNCRSLPDLAADDVIGQLAASAEDLDGQLDIERLIARLPRGCRAVLVLHDVEGFTHNEIAASLGIATGTSKAHLFRARNLMREWLAPITDQEARA